MLVYDLIAGREHDLKVITRCHEAFRPFRDYIIFDEFNDFLHQSDWTDTVGYQFTVRESHFHPPVEGRIDACIKALMQACNGTEVVKRRIVHVSPCSVVPNRVYKQISCTCVTDRHSIGD